MHDVTRRHGPSRPDRQAATPASHHPDYLDPNVEPALDDILSDPVVRLVMRRDRLDPRDVRSFMEATAEKLRDGRDTPRFIPAPVPVAGVCYSCR